MLNLLHLSSKLSITFGNIRNKTLWSLPTKLTKFSSTFESWYLYLHTCNYEHNGFTPNENINKWKSYAYYTFQMIQIWLYICFVSIRTCSH
jgi:hypothetical protein